MPDVVTTNKNEKYKKKVIFSGFYARKKFMRLMVKAQLNYVSFLSITIDLQSTYFGCFLFYSKHQLTPKLVKR